MPLDKSTNHGNRQPVVFSITFTHCITKLAKAKVDILQSALTFANIITRIHEHYRPRIEEFITILITATVDFRTQRGPNNTGTHFRGGGGGVMGNGECIKEGALHLSVMQYSSGTGLAVIKQKTGTDLKVHLDGVGRQVNIPQERQLSPGCQVYFLPQGSKKRPPSSHLRLKNPVWRVKKILLADS